MEEIEVRIYFAEGVSQLLSLKPFRRALSTDMHDLLQPITFLFTSTAHLSSLYYSSRSWGALGRLVWLHHQLGNRPPFQPLVGIVS